ncbi:UNVERIFIED_CONTAM: hypothetical protein GTU68_019878 [Idotea baltica]|nr:hypothetical protein [Idotea baltica]
MITYPDSFQKLVNELSKLPSIGEKSASRLAYYLLTLNKEYAQDLSNTINKSLDSVKLCEKCFFLSDEPLCKVCSNPKRDQSIICVVEKPMDLVAIERSSEFTGLYHVLHGLWSPLRGQGPESIKISELTERVTESGINEVILATGATVEGDATALYIAKILKDKGISSSRLAQGVPKGGELEYLDDVTVSRAFSGRNSIN